MSKKNHYFLRLFLLVIIGLFLIGCQKQTQGDKEMSDSIKIVDETQKPADEEIEKEFDDGLDMALGELEEIEKV
ncbi:hypothetical protein HYU50_04215 [Candidatus Woesearchaeota archaeon]|nr:hypothetical protein [Candidatus Woesearchaeota archaeon]